MMKQFPNIIFVLLFFFIISIPSCTVKKTENPAIAYKYWSGSKAPKEIELIHARYWESSHWSKEYIMYMELKAPTHWIQEYIEQNKLIKAGNAKITANDIPAWFNPSAKSKIYTMADSTNRSVYYYDSLNHKLLIYEIQL
ncbi:MAG: hypothetical protein QM737_19695 [Ferruginibacter sp.]